VNRLQFNVKSITILPFYCQGIFNSYTCEHWFFAGEESEDEEPCVFDD